MKYLGDRFDLGAESQEDAATSSAAFEAQLAAVQDRLGEREIELESPQWRELTLQEGRLLVALERGPEAWQSVRWGRWWGAPSLLLAPPSSPAAAVRPARAEAAAPDRHQALW